MTRFPELPGIVPLGLKDFLPLTAPVLGQSGPLRNAASIRTGHCLDWLCTGRRANHPGGCEPCHECHKSQVNLFGLEKRMFQSNVGIYKQPVRGMNEFLGTVHWVLFDFLLWVLRASVAKACHTHHPVAMDLLWACFGISCRRKCSKWIKWQLNERSVARKHAPVFCLAASQLPAASHHVLVSPLASEEQQLWSIIQWSGCQQLGLLLPQSWKSWQQCGPCRLMSWRSQPAIWQKGKKW